jgi:hypothetical protein
VSQLIGRLGARQERKNGHEQVEAITGGLMPKKKVYENSLISVTGEYYIAAELCRRGFLAVLTPRNYPRTDIIVHIQ